MLGSTIIPAPTGFNVIEVHPSEKEAALWEYFLDPIVAFAVPNDGTSLIPVLIDGWKVDGGYWAIRHPSGRCERPCHCDFPTEDAWKAGVISEWHSDQKQRLDAQ